MQHIHSLVTLLFTFFLSVSSLPLGNIVSTGIVPASYAGLPLFRRVNSTGTSNLLQSDQARAQALRQRAQDDSKPRTTSTSPQTSIFQEPVMDKAVMYVIQVGVGEPPIPYNLVVDTGSSNTWVGANNPVPYSCVTADEFMTVTYGSGFVLGCETIAQIILAGNLVISQQSIGVAMLSHGFDGVDGILGIGPQKLTLGSIIGMPNKTVPTVVDNAWKAGLIDAYQIGISFHPYDSKSQSNGELTFGGVDEGKFTGPLNYVSITTTSPASNFIGIDQGIQYGNGYDNSGLIMSFASGILDTGTTLILLATDAFEKYQSCTGGELDSKTGLLRIQPHEYNKLKSLYFMIGGVQYELTPNAQIWPRVMNEAMGGDKDGIYLIVNDLGSNSGQGLDFINGMSFLERFYMVYDVEKSRVGLATTPYTYSDTN